MQFILNVLSTPDDPSRFVPLLIVLGLAFLVPLLLARFRNLPNVVGEIIFGATVGPSLLGWVTEGPILIFMSDIGLAFLMFLAGMEIQIDLIFGERKKKVRPNILFSSLLIYGATLGLAYFGAFGLQQLDLEGDLWLLTFVLSATSLGVLLPILKERDLLRIPFGKIVFLTAMLADFITVILLTIHLITLDKGFDPEIFTLGILFVAFLVLYKVGPNFVRIPTVENLIERLSGATVQIKVRGAIAILMAFVVLAEFVDAELILGAFLAGLAISLIKRPEDDGLIHNLEAFGFGFFIPVFFIMVGVNLDLQSLFASPEILIALPGFLVISLMVKVLPMLLVKRDFKWKELLAGGLLLNTHLSLTVAIAVIGLRANLFSEATSTLVIVFAVLTVLSMPLLFALLAPKVPPQEEPYTLFFGVSELGTMVAEQLRAHGDEIRFVPCADEDVGILKEKSIPTLDINIDELELLDVSEVRAAMILHDDDVYNLRLAQKARNVEIETVIAQVTDPQYLSEFENAGIKTFSPALMRPTMISMMARNPDALDLLTTISDERASIEVELCNVDISGKQIREMHLPGDLLILAIRRNNQLIIPRGGTAFEMYDRITLLGGLEDLRAVRELFGG